MFKWRSRQPSPPEIEVSPEPAPVASPDFPEDSLLGVQMRIMNRQAALRIVDAGAQHGQTAQEYLEAFPNCHVIALEPEGANHAAAAAALAGYGDRVALLRAGLSDIAGEADLRMTSHSGAHSLLEVGDMRYYDEPVDVLLPERIKVTTIDLLCAQHGIGVLDILKMDIQGGELLALKGAEVMLSRGAIRLIALEVLFQPLYQKQPSFWDLADYLRAHDYAFHGLYEAQHHAKNPAVLRWADAIFVAPHMTAL